MTPYARSLISNEEVAIFEKVRSAVLCMHDVDLGVDEKEKPIILSCHILARAVARAFSLQYVDGYFCPQTDNYFGRRGYRHSWIYTPGKNIMDVYPIAVLGGPIMMDGNNGLISQLLYSPENTRKISRGLFGTKSFKRAVSVATSALYGGQDGI